MQRRPQLRASKKARLAFYGLGSWLFCLSSGACLSAQGPMAVASDEEDSKEDHAPASDQKGHQGDEEQEESKDKKKGPKNAVEHSKAAVDIAVAEKHRGRNDESEPYTRPNSIAPDDRPEVVKDASARIMTDYRSRLAALHEQNVVLKRRSQAVSTASKDLMAKLDEIAALEDRLQRELGIGKARREYRGQRIKSLAALIMTMPPQSGARILSNMSQRDAQEIVLGMAQKSERKAAKLLAQMPPNKAAELGQRYLSADTHIKGSEGLIHKSSEDANKKEQTP